MISSYTAIIEPYLLQAAKVYTIWENRATYWEPIRRDQPGQYRDPQPQWKYERRGGFTHCICRGRGKLCVRFKYTINPGIRDNLSTTNFAQSEGSLTACTPRYNEYLRNGAGSEELWPSEYADNFSKFRKSWNELNPQVECGPRSAPER